MAKPRVMSDIRKIPLSKRRKAYFKLLQDSPYYQDSLQNRISADLGLAPEEIDDVLTVIGNRCRADTVRRLAVKLSHVPHIASYGLFGRLLINPAQYVAGQDYRAEMPYLRKLILSA